MRDEFLPYYRPLIEDDDISAVVDCMRRGWLTTGPKTKDFERVFAESASVQHAIAVNSCTAALKLALVAFGVGPGDEVIMPALSFVAGAECVKQLGAEPVFCDIDAVTFGITPDTIRSVASSKTKAVIPMHYGGQPVGVEEISEAMKPLQIAVIEDAAHAVGTLDGGRWPGAYSDAAAYSFYATKNITSAEGGMFVTNRDDIAERVRILSLHGMDKDAWKRYTKGGTWRYDVVDFGYKFNLPDVAAALGLSQLCKLAALQAQRAQLADAYLRKLKDVPFVKPVPHVPAPPDRHSWCVFAVLIDDDAGVSRDQFIEKLRAKNIGTSVHFIPTHLFSAYRSAKRGKLEVTERVWRQMVSLPLYPGMTEADVDDVLIAIDEILSTSKGRHEAAATS